MANTKQNYEFRDNLFSEDLLDIAIEWIQNHMHPEDVFPLDALQEWAEDNGYIEEP